MKVRAPAIKPVWYWSGWGDDEMATTATREVGIIILQGHTFQQVVSVQEHANSI